MSDLIARLRHQSDDHNALGMGIFREAADALTAQENALGFLRQISEQQAYEINQQAATIAEQAREIEALRAFAQGLVDDYQSEDGMAGAKYIVRDAVAALASGKAVTP